MAVKKAFYAKSMEWHPDKRPPEEKEEATAEFQRINAACESQSRGRRAGVVLQPWHRAVCPPAHAWLAPLLLSSRLPQYRASACPEQTR